MRIKISVLILVFIFFSFEVFAQKNKKAQAANPEVDIYMAADFDSEIIETIRPGTLYTISSKPKGAFYQIKLKSGQIGYVPDTELEIEGEGVFQPKDFDSDLDTKLKKNKKNVKIQDEEESEEEDPDSEKLSYHGMTLQLINYHEETLGGTQVGDLYAIGYRNYPQLNDYASSFAWGLSAAFRAPAYYQQLTERPASGFAFWSDFQVINVTALGSNSTVHYGAGPFLKLTQFTVSSPTRGYTLQDITVGLFFELGLIFHFDQLSYDLNLRYYWDKKSYGAIGFGVLF